MLACRNINMHYPSKPDVHRINIPHKECFEFEHVDEYVGSFRKKFKCKVSVISFIKTEPTPERPFPL